MLIVCIDRGGQHTASGSHAKVQRIEEATQVDEERIGNRTCECPDSVRQRVDALLAERGVIRHGARADVGGNGEQSLTVVELLVVGAGQHGDGICLPLAEALRTRAVQSSDRWQTGQSSHEPSEHIGQANLCLELELEGDIFHTVMVVIDLHFVQHVGIEGKIIRAVEWARETDRHSESG